MSTPRRRKAPARNQPRRRQVASRDFWGNDDRAEHFDEVLRPIDDSTALIRSLGPPPLPGHETAAEHYFAAVYDKAATLAIALAAASDLLADDDHDD